MDGEEVQIIFPGQYNTNQGPDFLNARLKINRTMWIGSVELHLRTSDWKRHRHEEDRNYKNVILHVVWEDDAFEHKIPVLELKDRVSKILLERYDDLMNSSAFIPCENSIHAFPSIHWEGWKQRLIAERLLRKTKTVESFLRQSNYHWEETLWWLLARNFGMKVNGDAFESVARSLPLQILSRHRNQIHQLEALLLGQAGLLEDEPVEDYAGILKQEYEFHRLKYHLHKSHIQPLFLRMRPGNFPTIRLAQLAMLIHQSSHLFSILKEAAAVDQIRSWLNISASKYWNKHYRLNEASGFRKKQLGSVMIDNIIINTAIPVIFAYGEYHAEDTYKQKALGWLETISAENNKLTQEFRWLGISNKTAYDSQALIEMKNEYCNKKRCLDCSVGNFLLKKISPPVSSVKVLF